jgi:hypothetical protein
MTHCGYCELSPFGAAARVAFAAEAAGKTKPLLPRALAEAIFQELPFFKKNILFD